MKILFIAVVFSATLWTMARAKAQDVQFDAELLSRYQAEAEEEAEDILQQFEGAVKPRYQTAYEDYLYDLQMIYQTGRAPDNEALYNDLRMMNSNELFVYGDNRD